MALRNQSGKILMLRVNEVGDSFGRPPDNFIAEVIVQLDSHVQGAASGFQLRADANQPARQGMLDLLRDAFNQGWRVHFDHEVPAGKTKGTIIRVWVTKDAPSPVGGTVGGIFGTVIGPVLEPAPGGGAIGGGGIGGIGGIGIHRDAPAAGPVGTLVFKTVATKPEE
ncbi:MAG: hypothetical protein ABIQ33_13030 [Caldimonas sp.]